MGGRSSSLSFHVMGNCLGGKNPYSGTKGEQAQSSKIDEFLRKERRDLEHEVKLLLLGAGESGKSTITKQMKIIHLKGFTDEERLSYKDIIHSNVIMAMRAIINATEKLGVNNIAPENKDLAEIFTTNEILFEQKVTPEIADYFISSIDRIVADDYCPTPQDLLRARARTTGITEICFDWSGVHWRMVDVGGQRNERKKWIHCFQDV